MTRPAPYPADVRAKGWRFEIDMEKIKGSDTWLRARSGPVRAMLLLLWSEAWVQTPCGSLPDDDELIALMLDMDDAEFAQRKAVLMRGWWRADDGRLYHETITERVLAMMTKRRSDADRQAHRRAIRADSPEVTGDKPNVTRDKGNVTSDSDGGSHESNTGTGTRTRTDTQVEPPPPDLKAAGGGVETSKGTKAGEICKAIKARKVQGVNPSNPELLALIGQGVDQATFEAAADVCAKHAPPKNMNYLISIVRRQLGEAAAISAGPGVQAGPWDATRSSIEAKAAELGLTPWNEHDLRADRETFPAFTARVRRALERREGQPA